MRDGLAWGLWSKIFFYKSFTIGVGWVVMFIFVVCSGMDVVFLFGFTGWRRFCFIFFRLRSGFVWNTSIEFWFFMSCGTVR